MPAFNAFGHPRQTARELILDTWDMDADEVRIATAAVEYIRRYRARYLSHYGQNHGEAYEGESAADFVDEMMPGEPLKKRVRVLQVACSLAAEDGLDMTTSAKSEMRRMVG